MPTNFSMQRRIEFCETDAAGIAHFAAFFQYMEQAEHALLRHAGLSVIEDDEEGTVSWPRVSASCDYEDACQFEDVLDVEVHIENLSARSITYAFTFTRDNHEIARGKMTSVCCRIVHGKPPTSIEIPDWIRERLRPFAP